MLSLLEILQKDPGRYLIGCTVRAKLPALSSPSASSSDDTKEHLGTLLEVKRHPCCRSSSRSQNESTASAIDLIGFVRWKELSRKLGCWVPIADIVVLLNEDEQQQIAVSAATSSRTNSPQQQTTTTTTEGTPTSTQPPTNSRAVIDLTHIQPPQGNAQIPLCSIVSQPFINPNATRKTVPHNKNSSLADFFEDRLSKDVITPPTVRKFHYLGRYEFDAWFYSPFGFVYPQYDARLASVQDAHICPFSLTPFPTAHEVGRFCQRSKMRRPPGKEIYRDASNGISLFEVNGSEHRVFCRNLFLIGKTFLENKLCGHDVDLYYFYVVCLNSDKHFPEFLQQFHCGGADSSSQVASYVAGFFSWEKRNMENNLACVVTLPCFQGMGLGQFLIHASYELNVRRNNKARRSNDTIIGTPERPLSDLGQAAYDKYWQECAWKWIATTTTSTRSSSGNSTLVFDPMSIVEIAEALCLSESDTVHTLLQLGLVHYSSDKKNLELVLPENVAHHMAELCEGKRNRFDVACMLAK